MEYACRAAIQLAKHHDGETSLRLDDLAARELVPRAFLVQILSDLKTANLVISRRGKAGGYLLATAPEQITLAQIITAVEPSLLEEPAPGAGESAVASHRLWSDLSRKIFTEAAAVTLDQLTEKEAAPMWFI